MRIGVDCRDLFLSKTGTKTVLEELLNSFRKRSSIEIIEFKPRNMIPAKTKIAKIAEHLRFIFWKEITLPLRAKISKVDVLICNDYVAPAITFGIRTLPIIHGVNFWLYKKHYNRFWLSYFSFLTLIGMKNAHQIITVSEFSKRSISQILKFDSSRITVVPVGPKTFNELDEDSNHLKKWFLENKKYILHVGVFEKRKNIGALVEAFSRLEDSTLKLVLAGPKGYKKNFEDYDNVIKKIKKLHLSDRVILTGYVSNTELKSLYEHCNLYVFPSNFEGFGIPILEAFKFKAPVITSDLEVFREIIGNDGIYFDQNSVDSIYEAIKYVSKNNNIRKALILNGEKRLQTYNWDKGVDKILQLI